MASNVLIRAVIEGMDRSIPGVLPATSKRIALLQGGSTTVEEHEIVEEVDDRVKQPRSGKLKVNSFDGKGAEIADMAEGS